VLAHLARAGLALAYPKEDVYFAPMPERHLDSASTDDRQALLARVDLFQPLTDDELASLAERMERRTWSAGEVVIREGDTGHSMLCVVEGLLEAFTEEDGRRCRLGSIGPGEFIGEMSVLTGEPRSATVVSATDGVAYEIGKEPFRSLLTARPELAELISRIIAERRVRDQRAIEALAADEPTTSTKTLAGQILGRIRSFFGHR
jgi:CRP-like cAMP-binding protein